MDTPSTHKDVHAYTHTHFCVKDRREFERINTEAFQSEELPKT